MESAFARVHTNHLEGAPVHGLPSDDPLQFLAEAILAQHAQPYAAAILAETFRRPLDEFHKVEQEGGLHLIFSGLLLCHGDRGAHS